MIKKVTTIALALSILVSGAAFAGNNETGTMNEENVIEWQFTFEEEKTYLKDQNVNATDMASLEKLFDEAIKLEKKEKYDEAIKVWEKYTTILNKYYDDSFTFEDDKEWLEDLKVNATDMARLEKLYNEAIKLDESNKESEANKKWQEIDVILESYYENEGYSFEDVKEWLVDLEVNKVDMTKLEVLYNELIKLEENNKETEVDKKWQEIEAILENYYGLEAFTFEDEKEWLNDLNVDAKDMVELERIFNEAIALEKDNKDEAAKVKWETYYTKLDNYMSAYDDFDYGTFTFDEEKDFLKEYKLDSATMQHLEKLFNEALALEKSDKSNEANAKWDAYEKLFIESIPEYDTEANAFEAEKAFYEEIKLDAKTVSALEKIFKEAYKLEKAEKFDAAEVHWTAYDKLLDEHLPENYFNGCTIKEE